MSKSSTKYISTKHHLAASAESLAIGYWTNTRFHIERARDSLMVALSGSAKAPREHLVDLIAGAIDDTIDVDWTSEQAAERVVEVLLDDAIPMLGEGE